MVYEAPGGYFSEFLYLLQLKELEALFWTVWCGDDDQTIAMVNKTSGGCITEFFLLLQSKE